MDLVKGEWKRNLIQAWRRCRSQLSNRKFVTKYLTRSKTWHCSTTRSSSIGGVGSGINKSRNNKNPDGYFAVYVGPEKQRFVIKTEYANHPLFKILLEDAELEYGFNNAGPILLPCDVNLFYKVLAEVVDSAAGDEISSPIWSPMILCSPRGSANRGYKLLSPSRFLKLNQ